MMALPPPVSIVREGDEAAGHAAVPVAVESRDKAGGQGEYISKALADEDEKPVSCLLHVRDPFMVLLDVCMPSKERYWSLFVISIGVIMIASYLMVDATIRIGCVMTIPPFLMGLLFLAAGTSVPDALASMKVAAQGHGDMAVANALGSNVFDILLCLGLPWTIKCAAGRKVEFPNAKQDFVKYGSFLLVALGLFIATLVAFRGKLNKWAGTFMLLLYGAYVLYTCATSFSESDSVTCTGELGLIGV
jgi:hypothetical protein